MTDLQVKLWFEKYGGWVLIWFFCALPVFRWFSINDFSLLFTDWYSVFSSLGKIFGIVGFVLYAINLVLAIRRPWLENFFLGLNRVYIAHHITGGLALAFIAFHPLFLAIRYIELGILSTFYDSAAFLWPRSVDTSLSYLEVQENVALNAGIIAFLGMVVLLILTFFIKLPYRLWLFTHRFLGLAFAFAGIHVLFINSDTGIDPFLRWYMVIWTLVGLGAFLYRTVFGNVFVRRAAYKVSAVHINGSVVGMELSPISKPVTYKAGQFVFIKFRWADEDGIISEAHPFSIASGEKENVMRLYVKALGDYTSSLSKLKEGTVAEVEGAFGRFVPARYGTAPQVWIAGGIGITPFIGMARTINQLPQQIQLIHSVKTRSELVEEDTLKNYLPKNYKNFTFQEYVSDEQTNPFIDAAKIDEMTGGLKGKEIFLCGPPPMMKSLREQLKQMGIPNRSIHSEEFTMT